MQWLLDFAVSANLVFGQRAIYALGAEERSRLNGLFMAMFFAGGALAGDAFSGVAFTELVFSALAVGALAFDAAVFLVAALGAGGFVGAIGSGSATAILAADFLAVFGAAAPLLADFVDARTAIACARRVTGVSSAIHSTPFT